MKRTPKASRDRESKAREAGYGNAIRCRGYYRVCVKSLTVKVPDELAVRLEKRARRFTVSKSAMIRESLERERERYGATEEEPSAYDLVKEDLGRF